MCISSFTTGVMSGVSPFRSDTICLGALNVCSLGQEIGNVLAKAMLLAGVEDDDIGDVV